MTVLLCLRPASWVVLFAVITTTVQDDTIRLILGPNPYTGLVQITHQGRTGLVCDDGFGKEAGVIVCRQIGYPTSDPRIDNVGRFLQLPANMTYILDDLSCQGYERTLSDCQHKQWFEHNCGEGETVGLFCDDNPCLSSEPCKHNSTCTMLSSVHFHCDCSPGVTGSICETDINECDDPNNACSHKCVNEVGSYHCECPDVELVLSKDNHTCVGVGQEVACTSQTMSISFDKAHFPGLQAQYVTLTDTTCRATDNGTHITVTSSLDACGTKSRKLGINIVYENSVKSREVIVDGVISRVREVEIPFSCIVPVAEKLEIPFKVDRSVLTFTSEGRGELYTRLELFHDKNYVIPPEKPFRINPGDAMHVQVSLNSNGSDLTPFALRCFGTPTRNISYSVYNIINDGCVVDTTLVSHHSQDETKEQFSFQAFKYLDNSPSVFLNCDVIVCMTSDNTSRCSEGCRATNPGRRRVRDVENGHVVTKDVSSHSYFSLSSQSTVVLTGAVTCAVSFLFLVSVIVYKKCVTTNRNNKALS